MTSALRVTLPTQGSTLLTVASVCVTDRALLPAVCVMRTQVCLGRTDVSTFKSSFVDCHDV